MRFRPLILPLINAILWGLFAFAGFDGEIGVEERVGHVQLGQVQWYVVFPLIMLIVSVVPAALLSQTKWSSAGNLWSALILMVFLPFACLSGGGM